MPQAKVKPSDIAAEAKRTYLPYIEQKFPQFPSKSYLYADSSKIRVGSSVIRSRRLRVAVIDGDPVDVALDWFEYNKKSGNASKIAGKQKEGEPIPVVSMANEKRAGGDWESGLSAPEECLCRRSNLVQALTNLAKSCGPPNQPARYPIQTTGGVYSPHVGTS